MNSLDVFHSSGWYNLASLWKIVVTSLLVEVKLIPSTWKGLVENKEPEDIEEGGGDWGRGEFLEPTLFRLSQSGLVSGSQGLD